jgi:tetratricopeptide (TPR) repeat protein
MSNRALLNGDLERARTSLEEACRYDPNNNSFTVHYNLGTLYEKLQDYTSAKKAYSEAIEFTKDKAALANAYTQLGQVSERLNDPDKAIDCLVKAQSYGKIDAAISLAEVYKSAGRIPEAILCLEEFIRKGAASPALKQAQATIESLRKADVGVGNPNSPDYLNGKRIQRWEAQRMPLKIFINQDIRNPFYKRNYTQMMQQALDAWCAASNNKIGWSESDNADDANITVDWASFPESTAEAGITNASTFGRSDSDRTFNKAAITIYTLRRDGSDVSDKEVNATCLHESGHALGLPHSANNQDIMFFANSPHCLGKLTKRDMETISKLYDDAAAVSK